MPEHIHFIAIGGSIMHQLAIALSRKGNVITGSDDEIFEPALSNLRAINLLPSTFGWKPENITSSIDSVILGMHARMDNPELIRARELGFKIYSFPEYVYKASIDKLRVAIGGSHGKTSTTAMVMHVLKLSGYPFDFLVGAKLPGFDYNVQITDAPVIICEADEYPASAIEKQPKFHFLYPNIAVLTGIAWDHINMFPTFDFYLKQFEIFLEKIVTGGVLIYNDSDSILKKLVEDNNRKDITYHPYSLPTFFIEDGKTEVLINGYKAQLQVFGNHNLLNLNAAWLVCRELNIKAEDFIRHIASFQGASKRLELLYSNESYNVYKDFAHAPSKVKASINAVSHQFPGRKLIALLELHTYSSLSEQFLEEYKNVMDMADQQIIFYSAHALEIKRLPQLSAEKIKSGFGSGQIQVYTDKEALRNLLTNQSYKDTNLLIMSSGDFDGLDFTVFHPWK